jgi:hypothetical protein
VEFAPLPVSFPLILFSSILDNRSGDGDPIGRAVQMFQCAGDVDRAGKHDDREIGDQGCPRNSNNAITSGELDLGGEARDSEDGGHDDLEAHDAGATEKHRDGGSATFHDSPESEAEKQNERGRDARADPPGEQAMRDEQHRYRRDRGETESQDKRTFESSAHPGDIAARDGFSIGGPERRSQHGDHQGNQRASVRLSQRESRHHRA